MHKRSNVKNNVLIAGIAGASLGTEILKSLLKAKKYNVFGTDISPFAYGHYHKGFQKTFVISTENYIEELISISKREKIEVILPGGEKPLVLISQARKLFDQEGIKLAINNQEVIDLCTDKYKTFNYLKKCNIFVPQTELLKEENQLKTFNYPCIIKPSVGSGGSANVYFAENQNEASNIFQNFKKNGTFPIIQEYINFHDNEYTVGILSLKDHQIVKSIAMKRIFPNKLSYIYKDNNKLISSGFSQGEFASFKDICKQSEVIAKTINSSGPINIQGRLKDDIFYPFEINPRFSATTYLRALAGFNEIDIYLQYLISDKYHIDSNIKFGYYFRTLTEHYIPKKASLV